MVSDPFIASASSAMPAVAADVPLVRSWVVLLRALALASDPPPEPQGAKEGPGIIINRHSSFPVNPYDHPNYKLLIKTL